MREAWTSIEVDGQRKLLYGPRFGRLYLLPQGQSIDQPFTRIVGLKSGDCVRELADPVERIALQGSDLEAKSRSALPFVLPVAYRVLAASRYLLPFRAALAALPFVARCVRGSVPPGANAEDIGRLVAATEQRVGGGDCYPRALMTALLCIAARRSCTVAVGVLSPTRKMHAWCGIDQCLPYEPTPEHYLYQPLWTGCLSP